MRGWNGGDDQLTKVRPADSQVALYMIGRTGGTCARDDRVAADRPSTLRRTTRPYPACKLGLEGIVSEAPRLALPLPARAALGQEQEPGGTGGQARSRGGLGQREMAITQDKMPAVFGTVLATVLIAAPAAHAVCRSPNNICKAVATSREGHRSPRSGGVCVTCVDYEWPFVFLVET